MVIKNVCPPKRVAVAPPKREFFSSIKNDNATPKNDVMTPPNQEIVVPPKRDAFSPPKMEVMSPMQEVHFPTKRGVMSPPACASPPKNEMPVTTFKPNKVESNGVVNTNILKSTKKDAGVKDAAVKIEKLSLVSNEINKFENKNDNANKVVNETDEKVKEESNGVGDKIKRFEKAAEDASGTLGRMSRPGSVRGRQKLERLGSDSDLPPPATPFKDNTFDLTAPDKPHLKSNSPNLVATKWQRSESNSDSEKIIQKPEPQKIVKPEFKPISSTADVTIRSPSLGAKIADQFSSHGTAFRNVASPDTARSNLQKFNEENTQNNFKTCKKKEKYSVSKGSSYFTRGSEEIWLVKKKDIEEIEERVLDSFRRAGGNVCMRSETVRPSSDSGQQSVSFSHATMGRNKRQTYGRSESLDPQWAGARSQTLKRQTSVACTCGHDKKVRAKSASSAAAADANTRPRSRSHGDENNQTHVLDKYETLV